MSALAGIRVLELCRVPPAELPGMMLADMGADVVKITTPQIERASPEARRQAAFSHTNRNKRSMALDMKSDEGQKIFADLARDADVIVEGFRPGVMARLGADYASLKAINPRLVYCSMSGFGQTGARRGRAGHDLNYLAMSGALSLWGEPDEAPDVPLNLVADLGGASMHAALAIMFALFARERSGQGQYIDIAYLDCTVALLAATGNLGRVLNTGAVTRRGEGVMSGHYPYYCLYATADKRWLSVACSEASLWSNFCKAIGHPEIAALGRKQEHYERPPNGDELAARETIRRIIETQDCAHWERHFADVDTCVAPVRDVAQMLDDPQVAERGLLNSIEHSAHGRVTQFASPMRLSETPPTFRRVAPEAGEHTAEVLQSIGIDQHRMERLREAGVVN